MTSVHYKQENLLPSNVFIEDCEYVPTRPYEPFYVEMVVESTDKLFSDICGQLKLNPISERQLVQKGKLNIRSVTKDKLIEWLENACYLLDTCSIPLLQKAAQKVEDTNKLQWEKIDDQKSIIELQKKLLEQTENGLNNVQKAVQNTVQEELKSAQNTLQTEMKSYSSVLTNTCSAALSQKKICAAVKSATDSEDRSRNLIIYGVKESDSEVLPDTVSDILQEIGERPVVADCCRIGAKRARDTTAVRPVKFTVRSSDVANQLLRKAKLLRSREGFKSVYISPDRTVSERRAYKKLLDELKLKREAEPDKFHIIRNNKIISTSEKRSPDLPG